MVCQGRSPAIATTPGPTASTAIPRRIGTERHTELRSTRMIMPMVVAGSPRAAKRPLSTRASSRGARRAAAWAAAAPATRATRMTASWKEIAPSQRKPKPSVELATNVTVGRWSR